VVGILPEQHLNNGQPPLHALLLWPRRSRRAAGKKSPGSTAAITCRKTSTRDR